MLSPDILVMIVLLLLVVNWSIYYFYYHSRTGTDELGIPIDKPWYIDLWEIITLGGVLLPFNFGFNNTVESQKVEIKIPSPELPEIDNKSFLPVLTKKEEVFNVDENDFTYSEARTVCKAFGARLATYGEVVDAHKKGANWCNYGWTENQMALFPIQEKYWEEIQKNPETRDTCGKPGVNGGYFDDPNLKFGANCWGIKPEADTSKIRYLEEGEDLEVVDAEKLILDKYKDKIKSGEIEARPFSSSMWSEFSHKKSVYQLTPNIEVAVEPSELESSKTTANNIFTGEQMNMDVI